MSRSIERSSGTKPNIRNRLIAGGTTTLIAAAAIAGCAEAQPQKLEVETVSSMGFELPEDVAKYRTQVLELCNTGEGAGEVRQLWKDLGYEERSGMDWKEAITFNVDFAHFDSPSIVVDYGQFVYPTVVALAENCEEAAFIISKESELAQPSTALPALEAYRENPDVNGVLTNLFNATRE